MHLAIDKLPVRLGLEGRQRQRRFGKHCRQHDMGIPGIELQHAAPLMAIDAAVEAGKPRNRAPRVQTEVVETGLDGISARLVSLAAPTQAQAADPAARAEGRHLLAQRRIQRQTVDQRRDDAEVEIVGARLAVGGAIVGRLLPIEVDVGRRDAGAVAQGQAQPARLESEAVIQAQTQVAIQACQRQHGQLRRQSHRHVVQAHIGSQSGQRLLRQRQPDAHAPGAARQIDRIVYPGPPTRQVGVIEFRIAFAGPCRQRLDVAADKVAAQVEPGRQRFRGLGRQAETMVKASIAQVEVELRQHQRRRLAQVVVPGDGGIANDDAILAQQPAREPPVLRLVLLDLQARGEQPAFGVATQVQGRRVDHQAREVRRQPPKRRPGEIDLDIVETQCRSVFGIANLEAVDAQVRPQALPVRVDPPYRHRLPQGFGQRALDVGAMVFDAGQHEMAQGQHQQPDAEISGNAQPQERTREPAGVAGKGGEAHGPWRARMVG